MRRLTFELCAETVDACLAGEEGGAHRVELCSGLNVGGLTPSHGLIHQAVERCGLPVHVLIRPRGGNFVYTSTEYAVMAEDIRQAKALGAAGVVFGLLISEGTVDFSRTRALADLARPMALTFHRAFDVAASLPDALEAIVALGFDRILTSGGAEDVVAGSTQLRNLIQKADRRIAIAVGGGLTIQNAASVARATGATHFHGSLRTDPHSPAAPSATFGGQSMIESHAVRRIIDALKNS